MRHRLYVILLLVTVTLSSVAQTVGEALYIYRNDGQFNAFFRDEVQSIEYSYEGTDGKHYTEFVTQIVNTADSIYKIPLSAIDSISFVQPEVVFQPNVIQMEQKGLSAYLQNVNGMSLLFKTSIPQSLQPKVGEILLSTDFGSSLLPDGFVGKVVSTQMQSDALMVNCETVGDIFEIFEQLISIEKVQDETASAPSFRRASGDWISSRNPINFSLGYSHKLSDGEVSISGSVDGSYIAIIAYNITRKDQYINIRLNHDWQYAVHLNMKSKKEFGSLKGSVVSLPAIRFPAMAPIFKFQVSGVPFVKGEGNMELDFSLNSPVHSYVAQAIYHNGHFSSWNHKNPVDGNNSPSFDTVFSLNGSLQTGVMVDFWLGIDIPGGAFKIGTGLDFYIGPKLTGDFSVKLGTENPINYYSLYKDSKLGLSIITVDYEFFGEASLAGFSTPRGIFCNGTFQSPFYHEWYIMPEFSELSVIKDISNNKATISTTPTRDILFPLGVGIGLYDSEGSMLSTKYESQNYKRENEDYLICQTFTSLETGKDYIAKPMIRILGGEVPALPVETFKFEDDKSHTSCPDDNHPHMIDLGLPSGTKWACCNIGAKSPEDYGGYYAWGETIVKDGSSGGHYLTDGSFWEYNAPYYNPDNYAFNNWVNDENDPRYPCYYTDIGLDIAGTQYDVAHVSWGDKWVMPSRGLMQELIEKVTFEPTTINGINGNMLTGPNGNSIFIPYAGYYAGTQLSYFNSAACLYSSSKKPELQLTNSYIIFVAVIGGLTTQGSDHGLSVRAVQPGITVKTSDATDVKVFSATLKGKVENYESTDGTLTYTFCYSTDEDVMFSPNMRTVIATDDGNGNFSATIDDMEIGTQYYYCAYVQKGEDKIFGDILSLTTMNTAESGDVNGDGKISVTDVVSIISYVLEEVPAKFLFPAADVNGDGRITVTDAVGVIDMILNKQ